MHLFILPLNEFLSRKPKDLILLARMDVRPFGACSISGYDHVIKKQNFWVKCPLAQTVRGGWYRDFYGGSLVVFCWKEMTGPVCVGQGRPSSEVKWMMTTRSPPSGHMANYGCVFSRLVHACCPDKTLGE